MKFQTENTSVRSLKDLYTGCFAQSSIGFNSQGFSEQLATDMGGQYAQTLLNFKAFASEF